MIPDTCFDMHLSKIPLDMHVEFDGAVEAVKTAVVQDITNGTDGLSSLEGRLLFAVPKSEFNYT